MPGLIEVLSVGKGDNKLTVGEDPEDRAKAEKMINDMIRRGYSIFVETAQIGKDGNPVLRRVKQFNSKRFEYIIAEVTDEGVKDTALPVGKTKATAIGPVAGG